MFGHDVKKYSEFFVFFDIVMKIPSKFVIVMSATSEILIQVIFITTKSFFILPEKYIQM